MHVKLFRQPDIFRSSLIKLSDSTHSSSSALALTFDKSQHSVKCSGIRDAQADLVFEKGRPSAIEDISLAWEYFHTHICSRLWRIVPRNVHVYLPLHSLEYKSSFMSWNSFVPFSGGCLLGGSFPSHDTGSGARAARSKINCRARSGSGSSELICL
jgi:hypothetical protein